MNENTNISGINADLRENAVSLYGQNDAMDDFPVLKAFQQYIDAEQAKSRKRMLVLCAFFGFVMTIVVTVFVLFLLSMSSRNQALNDRLVEFAMKDRDRMSGSPVVVQPSQDNSALMAMTSKINELQSKLAESKAEADRATLEAEKAKKAAIEATKPKEPSAEELEIQRLKALLAAEKEKTSVEKEMKRQAEIEAYRRKYYPELYMPVSSVDVEEDASAFRRARKSRLKREMEEADAEIDDILNDTKAVSYFDNDEEDEDVRPQKKQTKSTKSPSREQTPIEAVEEEKKYSIPVDVKGSSGSWSIPLD